jgi:hypothetical protein
MYGQTYSSWAMPLGASWFAGIGWIFFTLLIVWSVAWKGLALWRAAHKESKIWFVVLLLVNTVGILDILYLYVFSKRNLGQAKAAQEEAKVR